MEEVVLLETSRKVTPSAQLSLPGIPWPSQIAPPSGKASPTSPTKTAAVTKGPGPPPLTG